jgi:nitrate reductase beta subunit
MDIKWGPNWEDDLAGAGETGPGDVNFKDLDYAAYLQFQNIFMFYLPRLCEHCLNPACVASCPSGALYKRDEDGIVLVDQERCRGWRYCVSGCPYKKVYFNWKTGRAEKCIFCYPRIEAGLTPLCAHSCVGRIRYVGLLLYDADRILETASAMSDPDIYPALLQILLDPEDPAIQKAAAAEGIDEAVLAAARRSPVYPLIKTWKLALPLHPEFRTLPMVWYIPPLSPVKHHAVPSQERDFINSLRIPITYLANLMTAGDEVPVRQSLLLLSAVRAVMRAKRVENTIDQGVLDSVGMSEETIEQIYRLLSLATLEERMVLPKSAFKGRDIFTRQGSCGYGDSI